MRGALVSSGDTTVVLARDRQRYQKRDRRRDRRRPLPFPPV